MPRDTLHSLDPGEPGPAMAEPHFRDDPWLKPGRGGRAKATAIA